MSDYFGALIRSSGMAIAGVPAIAPAWTTGTNVVEVEAEHPAAATFASGDPNAGRQQQAMRTLFGAPPGAGRLTDELRTPTDGPPAKTERLPPVPATASAKVLAEASKHSGVTEPVHAETLIRKALQWVAADPEQAHAVSKPARAAVRAPSFPEIRADVESPAAQATRAENGSRRATSEPGATLQQPGLAIPRPSRVVDLARPTAATAPEATESISHEEVVEISIGTIQVRAEGPAAKTYTRPTVPTIGSSTQATSRVRDGALARRALRRF